MKEKIEELIAKYELAAAATKSNIEYTLYEYILADLKEFLQEATL